MTDPREQRQFRLLTSIGLCLVVALVLFAYVFSRSDSAPDSTSAAPVDEGISISEPVDISGSIPRPNSGAAPENPGDRGGYLQLALLGITVLGVGTIGFLAIREGRQNLARQRADWEAASTSRT